MSSSAEPRQLQGPINDQKMWYGGRNKWEGMKGMKGTGLLVSALLLKGTVVKVQL